MRSFIGDSRGWLYSSTFPQTVTPADALLWGADINLQPESEVRAVPVVLKLTSLRLHRSHLYVSLVRDACKSKRGSNLTTYLISCTVPPVSGHPRKYLYRI